MNSNNKKNVIRVLENLFSKIPKRCNCSTCIELHKNVKKELGLARYEVKCVELGIYKQ